MSTKVMRVPTEVQEEAARLAALRYQQPAALIAEAWHEYVSNHRQEFAADLEAAAKILRDGTLDDLANFASRNVDARAEAAARRARSQRRKSA